MPVAASAHEFDFAASGRRVLEVETRGLAAIGERIDGAFSDACRRILGSFAPTWRSRPRGG